MDWKPINEITRKEWIKFKWEEIQGTFGDDAERVFRVVGSRTPSEAYQAMEEWDMTAAERDMEIEEEAVNEK